MAALACLTCIACEKVEPRTQVMVVVDADLAVRELATRLDVTVHGLAGGAMRSASSEVFATSFQPMGVEQTGWPYQIALVPRGGDEARRYEVEARLFAADAEIARLRAFGGFIAGKTLALPLRFEESCLYERSLNCIDDDTCFDGACVPADVDVDGLPELATFRDGAGATNPPPTGTMGSGVVGTAGAPESAAGTGAAGGAGSAGESAVAGSGGMSVPPVSDSCGDGVVNAGEACDTGIEAGATGACPSQCAPSQACETSALEGTGCQTRCTTSAITALVPDDGCCPAGADANGDSDCRASCGNGSVEAGETCDPPESCASQATCQPMASCLAATVLGDPAACSSSCSMVQIAVCHAGDDCCPEGCSRADDSDCSAACGDGIVDPSARETCEPNSADQPCRTSCDDGNPCTIDLRTGSPNNCNVVCVQLPILTPFSGDGCCPPGANANNDGDCQAACGNGITEPGERCDAACPSTGACDDGDRCTVDTLTGSGCARQCVNTRITQPSARSDGCCPSGAHAGDDPDCPAVCGNGVREAGETCDPCTCADADPCTREVVTGSGCMQTCSHEPVGPQPGKDQCCPEGTDQHEDGDCPPRCGNGVVEPGETCDGNCPSCTDDGDPCTREQAMGTGCEIECSSRPAPADPDVRDRCCPSGNERWQDADCEPRCGNGHIERGEACDGGPDCDAGCKMIQPPDPEPAM